MTTKELHDSLGAITTTCRYCQKPIDPHWKMECGITIRTCRACFIMQDYGRGRTMTKKEFIDKLKHIKDDDRVAIVIDEDEDIEQGDVMEVLDVGFMHALGHVIYVRKRDNSTPDIQRAR